MSQTKQIFLLHVTALRSYLQNLVKNSKVSKRPMQNWQEDVLQKASDSLVGAKLLRGCLVCFSYQFGGKKLLDRDVLAAAAAIELAHLALLVHDDVIDNSDSRRGQPSWLKQYGEQGMAICAGDFLLMMAYEQLSRSGDLVQKLFSREMMTVCAGQMQDVALGRGHGATKSQLLELARAKTAGYSLALPLRMGAMLAARPNEYQRQLYEIGLLAGTIYQIRDDELGLFGSCKQMGKPIGDDIREGKQTLFTYYLWQAAKGRRRQALRAIFAKPVADRSDVRYVQEQMIHYGVSARVARDVRSLHDLADKLISRLPATAADRQHLRLLVGYCANRSS